MNLPNLNVAEYNPIIHPKKITFPYPSLSLNQTDIFASNTDRVQ